MTHFSLLISQIIQICRIIFVHRSIQIRTSPRVSFGTVPFFSEHTCVILSFRYEAIHLSSERKYTYMDPLGLKEGGIEFIFRRVQVGQSNINLSYEFRHG